MATVNGAARTRRKLVRHSKWARDRQTDGWTEGQTDREAVGADSEAD